MGLVLKGGWASEREEAEMVWEGVSRWQRARGGLWRVQPGWVPARLGQLGPVPRTLCSNSPMERLSLGKKEKGSAEGASLHLPPQKELGGSESFTWHLSESLQPLSLASGNTLYLLETDKPWKPPAAEDKPSEPPSLRPGEGQPLPES